MRGRMVIKIRPCMKRVPPPPPLRLLTPTRWDDLACVVSVFFFVAAFALSTFSRERLAHEYRRVVPSIAWSHRHAR